MKKLLRGKLPVLAISSLLSAILFPSTASAAFVWADAGAKVELIQSAILVDSQSDLYYQNASVKNISAAPLTGQFRLVVTSSSTPVTNADGTLSDGKPYKYLSSSDAYLLDAGAQSADVRIEMSKPQKAPASLYCSLRVERYMDENLLDNDNDGVANLDDRCPSTPAGILVDSYGCTLLDIGNIARASQTQGGVIANGNSGYSNTLGQSLSADGRYVVFAAVASNLISGDSNGTPDAYGYGPTDCFMKDMLTGTIERVSLTSSGGEARGGSNGSWNCRISDDARYVLFVSDATNVVSGDRNKLPDAFLRDMTLGTTVAISVDSAGVLMTAQTADISSDGKKAVFTSSGLSQGVTTGYLRDVSAGTTTLISKSINGTPARVLWDIAISADGKFTAYASTDQITAEPAGSNGYIFRTDLSTMETIRISENGIGTSASTYADRPVISADGRYVAFQVGSSYNNIYLCDTQTGVVSLVSATPSGTPTVEGASLGQMSNDGRFVTFYTADTLAANDTTPEVDVYVRDLRTGRTSLASSSTSGNSGNDWSGYPGISANGRFIAFSSSATNLIASSPASIYQTYVRDAWGSQTRPPADETPPSPPASLAVGIIGDKYAQLSWQASTDDNSVAGYLVTCFTGTPPRRSFIETTSNVPGAMPYFVTNLNASTDYSCKINAFDTANNYSSPSASVTFRTTPLDSSPAPTAPHILAINTGLSPAGPTGSPYCQIIWEGSTSANNAVAGYDIYRNGQKIALSQAIEPYEGSNSWNYIDRDLNDSSTYYYYVVAYDANFKRSPESNYVYKTTLFRDSAPPTIPVIYSGYPESEDSLIIYIKGSTDNQAMGSTPYRLYLNGVPVDSPLEVYVGQEGLHAAGTPHHIHIRSLSPGTWYDVSISAVDIAGNESSPSIPCKLRTKGGVPSLTIQSPPAGSTIHSSTVGVSGTIGDNTTRVIVNMVEARIEGGRFFAGEVPLYLGQNSIKAVAVSPDGAYAQVEITLSSDSTEKPVILQATPSQGVVPLSVIFSTTTSPTITPILYEWDLDGDGTYERQGNSPEINSFTHEQAQTIIANTRISDAYGISYVGAATIAATGGVSKDLEIALSNPRGLAVDRKGDLYVAQPDQRRVSVYDSNGVFKREISNQAVFSPVGVATDYNLNVYILDTTSSCIFKFDALGVYTTSIGCGLVQGAVDFDLDGYGNIYVLGSSEPTTQGRIYKFAESGQFITAFGQPGAEAGKLLGPKGVKIIHGDVHVADASKKSIEVFSVNGIHNKSIDIGTQATPSGLGFENFTQSVLIAEETNRTVIALDQNGNTTTLASILGGNAPSCIAGADQSKPGKIYVSTPTSNKVIRITLPVELPDKVKNDFIAALESMNVEGALGYFFEGAKQKFRAQLNAGMGRMGALVNALRNAQLLRCGEDSCLYGYAVPGMKGGNQVNWYRELLFLKDRDGTWKIRSF